MLVAFCPAAHIQDNKDAYIVYSLLDNIKLPAKEAPYFFSSYPYTCMQMQDSSNLQARIPPLLLMFLSPPDNLSA